MGTFLKHRSFCLISEWFARGRQAVGFRVLAAGIAVIVLLLVPFHPAAAQARADRLNSAQTQPGQIEIQRQIHPVGDDPDARIFEVETTLQGVLQTPTDSADIVLVLDVSHSMSTLLNDTNDTRLLALKQAANAFIFSVLATGSAHRIALVTYSGAIDDGSWNDAWIQYAFDQWTDRTLTQNRNALLTAVTMLAVRDGTNIQAGLLHAADVLDESQSTNKVVILMSDGAANFYYDDDGNTVGSGSDVDPIARDRAIEAAAQLHQRHDVRVFTVGLIEDHNNAEELASVLNPPGDERYQEAYYQGGNAHELNEIFAHMAQGIDHVADQAMLIDRIAAGFRHNGHPPTVEGIAGVAPPPVMNPDGAIFWQVGSIDPRPLTLRYQVAADEALYGAACISDRVVLDFTPALGNEFYQDSPFDHPSDSGRKQILSERSPVFLKPLARDDDVYQMRAGETLRAGNGPIADASAAALPTNETVVPADSIDAFPGLLANDPARIRLDNAAGWTTEPARAILVADSMTGAGSLLRFEANGSFEYQADPGSEGIHGFSYDLVSIMRHEDGTIVELSDRARVTIAVGPDAADSTSNPTHPNPGEARLPGSDQPDSGISGAVNRPEDVPERISLPKVGEVYDFWLPLRQLFGRK